MKIIHTSDLHLGQVIYQNYDRIDEHRHFFCQLTEWCHEERADALVVSGDVFDMQHPSARVKKMFTDYFVELHRTCPGMEIVVIAGNHDSASRIEADRGVWELAHTHLVGVPPSADALGLDGGWENDYVVRLESGYIVALPYMSGERKEVVQRVLDVVAAENTGGLPVVMMAHQAVAGADVTGHDFDIGTLRALEPSAMGSGFDYLALGHIHRPQTIGHAEDFDSHVASTYPSPVVRYSGSALHVSCDETYAHTVSVVEMDRHGGEVHIRQLRIDELRHFYVLPADGTSFTGAEEALDALKEFVGGGERGYIRFRFDVATELPPNFSQMVYDMLEPYHDEWRYNPKMVWTGTREGGNEEHEAPVFEVAELQQMTDPMVFVERTKDQYPGLDLEDVRRAFEEVRSAVLYTAECKM